MVYFGCSEMSGWNGLKPMSCGKSNSNLSGTFLFGFGDNTCHYLPLFFPYFWLPIEKFPAVHFISMYDYHGEGSGRIDKKRKG